ncbi:hypothetical protein AKJ09_05258 [Labilithrix luteola]|uniref:Pyridoxamine 5'-phosphate oxidase N-terminal domain-containing protein n=1 Tax=Labilithrix luteola TaxID=1391654 RepID=A0A0K1PZL4_9BACT|nr:pyridoxamine 5'-phosphate oxidase family protein [Labilithrix luteola]AKU98594.1 hypothetical protein AKJ09_05258 [Labilithrix luteola]
MNRSDLVAFLRRHSLAVQATTSSSGAPQAAVVGIVVTEDLELFFDTLDDTRKLQNLRRDPRVAFVIGWSEDAPTVQYEGIADEPKGDELERLKKLYFERFPDGPSREEWPGITYVRVKPTWIRHSDFGGAAPRITELNAAELARL